MKVKFMPQDITCEIKPGQSVLRVAQDNGIYVKSVCGGVPSCAECRVRVLEGDYNVLPPASAELSLIGTAYFVDRRRLSCQLKCFGDLTVDLSEQIKKEQIQKNGKLKVRPGATEDAPSSHAVKGSILAEARSPQPAAEARSVRPEAEARSPQPAAAARSMRLEAEAKSPQPAAEARSVRPEAEAKSSSLQPAKSAPRGAVTPEEICEAQEHTARDNKELVEGKLAASIDAKPRPSSRPNSPVAKPTVGSRTNGTQPVGTSPQQNRAPRPTAGPRNNSSHSGLAVAQPVAGASGGDVHREGVPAKRKNRRGGRNRKRKPSAGPNDGSNPPQ